MMARKSLRTPVIRAAEQALAEKQYVTPIDVLEGVRWLHPANVDRWRQGREFPLENVIQVDRTKVARALELLRAWAREQNLEPSETEYLARSRGRIILKFSKDGDPAIEREYRTHWFSSHRSPAKGSRQTTDQFSGVLESISLGNRFCRTSKMTKNNGGSRETAGIEHVHDIGWRHAGPR